LTTFSATGFSSLAFSITGTGSVTFSGFSSFLGLVSKSILPTFLKATFSESVLKISLRALSSARRFSSCSFSSASRRASFSFRFSSPTSLEAAFLLLSV